MQQLGVCKITIVDVLVLEEVKGLNGMRGNGIVRLEMDNISTMIIVWPNILWASVRIYM